MDWLDGITSGISAISDWVSDTFGSGSKTTKLSAKNAELSASVESQKALLASYQGTVEQLSSQVSNLVNTSNIGRYLPWVLGGAGVLGALLITRKGHGLGRI